jgi:hypothetical protein
MCDEYYYYVNYELKLDVMGEWIDKEWLPRHADQEWLTLITSVNCVNDVVLGKFDPAFELAGGYAYGGYAPIACDAIMRVNNYDLDGNVTYRSGAFVYRFAHLASADTLEVLLMNARFSDTGAMIPVAVVPRKFVAAWNDFSNQCNKLAHSLSPRQEVVIIGGHAQTFVPNVEWDQIILPEKLKADIMNDVESFFGKGIGVYKRLKLKPFRKLLLAGVPGTGKTMLCAALAKWAIDQGYLVVYVSSADEGGANFGKIADAISTAAYSGCPTLVLLEELDAYLHRKDEKALVLNVLDGSEALANEWGTLLIATTNYPEAIDERILKRPGRLDRIYIIPETREREDAEKMLRQYLGEMWRDEHLAIVPKLVGYPGAFIREVAVQALTQVAYVDGTELPLEVLEKSFQGLREQIEARDNFLSVKRVITFGQPNRN